MSIRSLFAVSLVVGMFCSAGCTKSDKAGGEAAPEPRAAAEGKAAPGQTPAGERAAAPSGGGDLDAAKALLEAFLRPGADHAALTKQLEPTTDDYKAVFKDDAAGKLESHYKKMWSDPNAAISPKEGQTQLLLYSATTEEIAAGQGDGPNFPGGYKKAVEAMKPGVRWVRFKFVKPGETLGMAFDGLTRVNGKWRFFPKPWRGLEGS
ncbi:MULTISPECIES: hypothetical protein [Polyangium]|uniref:Uncharacterized protein n=2 Tax=Polyangium TaxID=55 RepID=A0A4U1JK40_9BACT|nr:MULTISPECIES: hypothetical protein [Polyangium]MDI1436407.1 hypothetical protein [Polyangium sorediatum]TKD12196.1 hypothetical protein E8A74_06210 [Polyangium fumosum]